MILKERRWFDKASTQKIIEILNSQEGHEARFVGGCVRDSIIGHPVSDIDIATTMPPKQVSDLLQEKQIKVIPTGIQHGTVTALLEGDSFEITTLREDINTNGRHAEVAYTNDWKKDASRRDFTMNALYLDQDEKLYDFYDGMLAIENKSILFIGNAVERIKEDYLRILRFFRFSSYYGDGSFDGGGVAACESEKKGLQTLSKERIRDEFFKILKAPYLVQALSMMHERGILSEIFPSYQMKGAFVGFCTKTRQEKDDVIVLLKLLILSDFEPADMLAKRFKLSNKQKQIIHQLYLCINDNEPLFAQLYTFGKEIVVPVLIFKGEEEKLDYCQSWKRPTFPITAQDLKEKGVEEGKQLGDMLKKAEKWWLSHDANPTKKEVLAFLF